MKPFNSILTTVICVSLFTGCTVNPTQKPERFSSSVVQKDLSKLLQFPQKAFITIDDIGQAVAESIPSLSSYKPFSTNGLAKYGAYLKIEGIRATHNERDNTILVEFIKGKKSLRGDHSDQISTYQSIFKISTFGKVGNAALYRIHQVSPLALKKQGYIVSSSSTALDKKNSLRKDLERIISGLSFSLVKSELVQGELTANLNPDKLYANLERIYGTSLNEDRKHYQKTLNIGDYRVKIKVGTERDYFGKPVTKIRYSYIYQYSYNSNGTMDSEGFSMVEDSIKKGLFAAF